ncbi:MAG: peptidoglycan-binding protein [Clostridia bacterium]|nr:peptidoglycan-binding protein [Clostridia bacterium]
MMNKSCKMKRILALILAVLTLLPATPALAESYRAITGQSGLTVYADAAMNKQIGELPPFTMLTVKAVKGYVAQIRYGGYTVYADKNAVVAVNDIAIPGKANQNTRVFEEPDLFSRSAALKKGTTLNVLYTAGNWAMVEKGGNLGYTYVDHLTPLTIEDEEPEEEESVGDPFLPESEQASSNSSSKGVTIETVAAVVTAASLPVYKSASASSAKLGTLTRGQEVTVYAYNSSIAYIGLNGKYGFCSLKGLTRKSAVQQPETNDPSVDLSGAIKATVTASSVRVYADANTSSKSLGTLQKGVQVNVLSVKDVWAYIELNGNLGYCAVDALTKTSDLTAEDNQNKNDDTVIGNKSPLGTATVIEAAAPVYSSMKATTHSSVLKMGETVNFYGYDSKWVLVGKDGKFGFVPRKYLSSDSYAELKAEDSGAAVADLEKALLALGHLDGAAGNAYTSLTTEAVKRLQTACSMTVTGVADVGTLRVLYSGNAPVSPILSVSLSKGAKNDNVRRIQTRLNSLGYLSSASSIDGDYGNKTANAISLFQKACGATATGTADNATIRALYKAAAPTLPSGMTAADATVTSSGSSGNTTSMGNLASTTDKLVAGMSNAQKLEYVIYIAQQQLGKKYVFGSAGTKTFDCSGLTMYCFKQVGVSLRHSAYSEGYNSNHQKISAISSMRRGDLVFFNTMSDGDLCDHVGIYLGNNYFIHASSGAAKVVVSNLASGYYNRVFSWGRRILDT